MAGANCASGRFFAVPLKPPLEFLQYATGVLLGQKNFHKFVKKIQREAP